jgi:AbiA family abortive infection protein
LIYNEAQLGHFIDFELWQDSCRLQEEKINLISKNKNFSTLNIHYFSKIKKRVRWAYSQDKYFRDRISNNIFYGLKNEFFIKKYALPKNIYGLRNYSFISYGLNLVHNSIGLYLVKLTDDFMHNYYKKVKTIRSFYGGNLKYNNGQISFKGKNIYYRSEYNKFRKELVDVIENRDNVVIRLDFQNYFDNLSIEVLLYNLKASIKSTDIAKYKFSDSSIEEITFFFKYLMNNKSGIPQIDSCVVSGYIGYLYLCFLDLEIDTLMKQLSFHDSHIIRYVDDLYIVFKRGESETKDNTLKRAVELLGKVKDLAYYKYKLNIKIHGHFL